ncbi:MAG: glycosyltransferase family A protein [Dehalococcoidia bacterium]
MISVVIPVGPGRDDNLRLVLHSLSLQTYRDYEIVLVTNATSLSWVSEEYPTVSVHYVPHEKPNLASINRNVGVAKSHGDHIVFIDSDVVLCKEALSYYAENWHNFSERVIIGPYHWLPPMAVTKKDVEEWGRLIEGTLPRIPHPGRHNIGRDGRSCFHNSPDLLFCDYPSCLSMLSGNMGISRRMYDYIGGFDEDLPRAEDGAFGIACCAAGFQWSYDGRIVGGHLYHERDAATMALDPIPLIIAKWHKDDSWIGKMKWGQVSKDRIVTT